MAKYSYKEFFKKFPDIYQGFCDVVQHAENFEMELRKQNLVKGVRSLISIGAGTGELELSLGSKEGIRLSYIDPSESASEAYRKKAHILGLDSQCLETFTGGFEDYTVKQKYNLVLSIHSWYAFGKNASLLKKALSMVSPEGRLFIALISKKSLVWKLADLFQNKEGSNNLCAEDISEFSNTLQISHEFIENRRSFPASYFLKNNQLTQPARDVAAFLNFSSWEEIDLPLREKAREVFQASEKSGQIDFLCGCLVYKGDGAK
jgi:cyclopropane fatty-acyl-phospholipid synthase-like methyltransferase